MNNSFIQLQTTRSKTGFRSVKIESLETAVRSIQLWMQHGTTNYLEVLTAEQSLLSARFQQTAGRLVEIQGIINLYQALGGGRD